jgi:hypothetical protein
MDYFVSMVNVETEEEKRANVSANATPPSYLPWGQLGE